VQKGSGVVVLGQQIDNLSNRQPLSVFMPCDDGEDLFVQLD
jgi:hypothetical protein